MNAPAKALPYMPTKAALEDQNTPAEVLEPVRRIFGGAIDFDPCSNPGSIVGATREVMLPKWREAWDLYRVMPVLETVAGIRERRDGRILWGDGLSMKTAWIGNTFVNPPFSAEILSAFMARAHDCADHGDGDVILLTKVKLIKGWHRYVPHAPAVCFLNGRLTFGGAGGESAPFDCALVLWTRSRELVHRFALELDGKLGDVMFH